MCQINPQFPLRSINVKCLTFRLNIDDHDTETVNKLVNFIRTKLNMVVKRIKSYHTSKLIGWYTIYISLPVGKWLISYEDNEWRVNEIIQQFQTEYKKQCHETVSLL